METETPNMAERSSDVLPPDHEHAKKWFYRDPQGDLQGKLACGSYALWLVLKD